MKLGDRVSVKLEGTISGYILVRDSVKKDQWEVELDNYGYGEFLVGVDQSDLELIVEPVDPPKPGQIWVCNDNPRSKIFITEDGNGYHCELNETVYLSDAYVLKVFLLTWHKV